MRFDFISMHLPERRGAAAGRALRALADGLRERGHDVTVTTWTPRAPAEAMPPWFEQVGISERGAIASKLRALRRPRDVAARAKWSPREGAVAVAHEYTAFPAVRELRRPTVLLEHHLLRIDLVAARKFAPGDIQALRAQRAAVAAAPKVIATSGRVADAIGRRALVCPMPYPAGEHLGPVDEPVAGVVANWRWPPNAAALRVLLHSWPGVREKLPLARLLLAGPGSEHIGDADGVRALGPVEDSADVLAQCSVVPFPCPPSTGPKVKVFEALSLGRPVLTTQAGLEGLLIDPSIAAAMTFADGDLVNDLVAMFQDDERRHAISYAGRSAIETRHAPEVVAEEWVRLTGDGGPT